MSKKRRGYKVPPQSTNDIRGMAHEFKSILGVSGARFPVIKIIEILAAQGFIDLEIVEDLEAEGITTLEASSSGDLIPVIKLQEDVYGNACKNNISGRRARFTIAHELGHVVLHSNALRSLHRETDRTGEHKTYEDSEWQADTFASELLMDNRYIEKGDTEADIVERFGVSPTAARVKLEKLNRSR